MRFVKALQKVIWCMNFLLLVTISILIFKCILFPYPEDSFTDFPDQEPMHTGTGSSVADIYDPEYYRVIHQLSIPLVKETRRPIKVSSSLLNLVSLEGTMPNFDEPQRASVIIKLIGKDQLVPLYVGEEIKDLDGKVVSELEGVKLVEVYINRAVFDNRGKRETIFLGGEEMGTGFKPKAPSYNPLDYTTRRLLNEANRQVWEIDPKERLYALKNQKAIQRDIRLSFTPEGGVKINWIREGSIIAARGFKEGDIIKSINGRAVTRQSINDILSQTRLRKITSATVVIDRFGRRITLEYRIRR